MKLLLLSWVFLLFLLVPLAGYGQPTAAFADSVRQARHIPELSYAVVSSRKVLEIATSGRHSVALPDRARLTDRFHIGSNTKAITAFLIAHYVEQGKLTWATRFFDVFPDWQAEARPEYAAITLQDLLAHRARIAPFQGNNDPPVPAFTGDTQQKRRAFGRFVLTLPPVPADSAHPFTYSNADYTLATLLLEQATGRTWEALVAQVLNHDLHLHAGIGWPDNQHHRDTWGHEFADGKLTPVPSSTTYHLDYTQPAGDLSFRLKDYARFIQLQLDGLAGHDNYLQASTYAYLHRGVPDYALGWYNIQKPDEDFSTHAGTAGTYFTMATLDRRRGIGYILFTNAYSDETVEGVRLVLRRLKQRYGR